MAEVVSGHPLQAIHIGIRGFAQAGICFTLSPGSRVGILGAAGSGKTRLLRALARLDPLPRGQLLWGETDVSRTSLWRMQRLRHHVSLLMANPYNFFDATMRVDLLLSDIARDNRRSVKDILQESQIPESAANLPVSALSGTLRVKLALARIRHTHSPVVLVDDIFSVLVQEAWEPVLDALTASVGSSQALVIASRSHAALRDMDTMLELQEGQLVG